MSCLYSTDYLFVYLNDLKVKWGKLVSEMSIESTESLRAEKVENELRLKEALVSNELLMSIIKPNEEAT